MYAPGRVGSMGLLKNLRQSNTFSFKVESFISENRGATKFCQHKILNSKRPANIITLVRDPMSIMCSYYFSKCIKGWIPGMKEALADKNIPLLQQTFIDEVLLSERLDSHLYWFENDFIPSIGYNIFDHPFSTENKYSVIKNELYPTLVMRTDLPDSEKSLAVSDFLDCPKITITRENVRSDRPGSDTYAEFKNSLSVPTDIIEKIYTAPVSTHFFSPTEQDEMRKKWSI